MMPRLGADEPDVELAQGAVGQGFAEQPKALAAAGFDEGGRQQAVEQVGVGVAFAQQAVHTAHVRIRQVGAESEAALA